MAEEKLKAVRELLDQQAEVYGRLGIIQTELNKQKTQAEAAIAVKVQELIDFAHGLQAHLKVGTTSLESALAVTIKLDWIG